MCAQALKLAAPPMPAARPRLISSAWASVSMGETVTREGAAGGPRV
jgi:hypothetical protein